ncbi:hypothetical protein ES705_39190 [subsurface metagenome]
MLLSGDLDRIRRAFWGQGAVRKITAEIESYVRDRFHELYGNYRDYNQMIREEVKKYFNIEVSPVAIDSSNNVYVVGSGYTIKKFDSAGNEDTINWDKSIGGTAYSVAIDSANNVYVFGNKHNGTDNDWLIKKFDSAGIEDTINWDIVIM